MIRQALAVLCYVAATTLAAVAAFYSGFADAPDPYTVMALGFGGVAVGFGGHFIRTI